VGAEVRVRCTRQLLVWLGDVVAGLLVDAIIVSVRLWPAGPHLVELRGPPAIHRVVGRTSEIPLHHALQVALLGIHEGVAIISLLVFMDWRWRTNEAERLHRRSHVAARWVHVAVARGPNSGNIVTLVAVAICPRRLALVLRLAIGVRRVENRAIVHVAIVVDPWGHVGSS
jgi:hypothetical protein